MSTVPYAATTSAVHATHPAAEFLIVSPLSEVDGSRDALLLLESAQENSTFTPVSVQQSHLSITRSVGDISLDAAATWGSAFPLGGPIEPKLKDRIKCSLFVPSDIILLSELGASVDHYLKNLSVTPAADDR